MGFNHENYYEFGTGTGISLFSYLKALKSYCSSKKLDISKYNIFLFDSFEGLPEYNDEKNRNLAWNKREFSGGTDYIKGIIHKACKDKQPKITFIKGYYENSLTSELREQLASFPPSIVNVDVDYYESTKILLNWIYPILQNGTLFHFDDLYEYLGSPYNVSELIYIPKTLLLYEYLGSPYKGEFLAISEFNELHKTEKSLLFPFNNFGISMLNNTIYSFTKEDIKSPDH